MQELLYLDINKMAYTDNAIKIIFYLIKVGMRLRTVGRLQTVGRPRFTMGSCARDCYFISEITLRPLERKPNLIGL